MRDLSPAPTHLHRENTVAHLKSSLMYKHQIELNVRGLDMVAAAEMRNDSRTTASTSRARRSLRDYGPIVVQDPPKNSSTRSSS